ncbi:short subunit dehydrogenase [Winogradskyella pacifica]|uniref:Short subunit dehydrogenase n=1 Tax=Winogradskyella pacifica TaxID=664642 RepID=A0A3D9N2E2_9FLAO|nr:short subunit dehydrogenase [Winogradskyella pacifica]
MNKPKSFPKQDQELPGKQSKMTPEPEVIREDYKGSDKLKNKVALITGGDSGIGRSIAVHFAREGADVAIIYLSETADAEHTKAQVEKENQTCLLIKADVQHTDQCDKALAQCISTFGNLIYWLIMQPFNSPRILLKLFQWRILTPPLRPIYTLIFICLK